MNRLPCTRTQVYKRGSKETSSTDVVTPSSDMEAATLVSLPLPLALTLLSSCGPALADDTVDFANQNSGILGYTNGGLIVAFSPIVIYGVFYLYRATINPKAKLQDLLFVAAFCVVVANIASIIIFKKRVY